MTKNDWHKVYLGYLNESQAELAKEAKKYFVEICEDLGKVTKNLHDAISFTQTLLISFIDADEFVSYDELALFNYIFNFDGDTYNDLKSMIQNFRDNFSYDEIDCVVDNCSRNTKNKILRFGLCICAIDGEISVSEQKIIEKYAE